MPRRHSVVQPPPPNPTPHLTQHLPHPPPPPPTAMPRNQRPKQVGTCYAVSEMDLRAREIMERYGGSCAQSWACAVVATCYFSANPKHWCEVTNSSVCYDTFESCGLEHVEMWDFPPSLAYTPETPETLSSYVDSASPAEVRHVHSSVL